MLYVWIDDKSTKCFAFILRVRKYLANTLGEPTLVGCRRWSTLGWALNLNSAYVVVPDISFHIQLDFMACNFCTRRTL